MTRRELMRVGGSALLGLSLADILKVEKRAAASEPSAPARSQGPGFGRAKSVILCYLQGGPSHLDLWDPKDNCPERVRSTFNPISKALTRSTNQPICESCTWVGVTRANRGRPA